MKNTSVLTVTLGMMLIVSVVLNVFLYQFSPDQPQITDNSVQQRPFPSTKEKELQESSQDLAAATISAKILSSSTVYTWEETDFEEYLQQENLLYPKEFGAICSAQEFSPQKTKELFFCENVEWSQTAMVRYHQESKQLVYLFETDTETSVVLLVDTQNKTVKTILEEKNIFGPLTYHGPFLYQGLPDLSNDGTYLTFALSGEQGRDCKRYIYDSIQNTELFTNERFSCETAPFWSEDSQIMAYCANGNIITTSKSKDFLDPNIIYTTEGSVSCNSFDEEGNIEFRDSVKYDELVAIDGADIYYPLWNINPQTRQTEFVINQYLGF